MCYITVLSTTSDEDLSALNNPAFSLTRVESSEELTNWLEYPHKWDLTGRYGGCACHFRNWMRENPPEFAPPEDWFPEDQEDIKATQAFYALISRLVSEGHKVDSITAWQGDAEPRPFEVSISAVPPEPFRLLDGYRCEYKA